LTDAGAAGAWFPALTTMAGLQANWDFLSDFPLGRHLCSARRTGTSALPPSSRSGRTGDPAAVSLRSMEEMYLPD
jgi:hypothetical protein